MATFRGLAGGVAAIARGMLYSVNAVLPGTLVRRVAGAALLTTGTVGNGEDAVTVVTGTILLVDALGEVATGTGIGVKERLTAGSVAGTETGSVAGTETEVVTGARFVGTGLLGANVRGIMAP